MCISICMEQTNTHQAFRLSIAHSTKTRHKGQLAESYAAEIYKSEGFTIIERNFRVHRAEVDLIARKGNCLYFVEVKYRQNLSLAYHALKASQLQRISRAAEHFIADDPHLSYQVDALLIDKNLNSERIDNIMLSVSVIGDTG